MKKQAMTPTKLRLIMSILFVCILALNVAVFYIGYGKLDNIAGDVAANVAEANDSQSALQQLQTLKKNLEANQDVFNRTSLVAADDQNYSYQDQIVSDLTTYASRAGMTISNITFSPGGGAAGTPTPASGPVAATPAGLTKTTINVTLKNPVDYKGYLNFLHYIEQNLTKLKVANVTLVKSGSDTVTTDALSLEVNLR